MAPVQYFYLGCLLTFSYAIPRYLSQLSLWPKYLDAVMASCGLDDRESFAATVYFCKWNYVKVEAIVK